VMKLSFDPYMVFKSSKTPAGLYARQKWLGESHDRRWKKDFDETVEKLIAEQANDGSWHQSEVETIGRLFGLHLTVRETFPRIEAALKWLMNKIDLQSGEHQHGIGSYPTTENLDGLPFICSRPDMFLIGATLFLATIFGQLKHHRCTLNIQGA